MDTNQSRLNTLKLHEQQYEPYPSDTMKHHEIDLKKMIVTSCFQKKPPPMVGLHLQGCSDFNFRPCQGRHLQVGHCYWERGEHQHPQRFFYLKNSSLYGNWAQSNTIVSKLTIYLFHFFFCAHLMGNDFGRLA